MINNTAKKKLLKVVKNQLVLIVDGTYVRHQKRQNNYYQRRVKKKTNMCNSFPLCTTNGFVIHFAGLFYGTLSNASIMKIVLDDLSLKRLLLPNDIYLLLTMDFGMPLNS